MMSKIERKQLIADGQLISYLTGGLEPSSLEEGSADYSAQQNDLGERQAKSSETGSPEHSLEENVLRDTKPVLVFLHGWRSEASVWMSILEKSIDNGFSILALDLPGFGKSENPKRPFGPNDYSEVISEFLEKLGIDNVVLIGHSYGGSVAALVSLKGFASKLVLVGSAGIREGGSSMKKSIAGLLKPLFKPSFMQPLKKRIYKVIAPEDAYSRPDLEETYRRGISEDLQKHFAGVSIPTLLLWGEQDHDTPVEYGRRLNTLIKDSRLVVFPDAGHYSFLDDEAHFLEELFKFIEES